MPQGEHSAIQMELTSAINQTLKPNQISRAFCELRCTFGERSIVPDISVFVQEHIPRHTDGKIANTFSLAPDWTIEFLSPKPNPTQVTKNILHCLQHQTELGWLINPSEESVFVYYQDQRLDIFDDEAVQLAVPNFAESFKITGGELFHWLVD